MEAYVTLEARVLGQKQPLFSDWQVALAGDEAAGEVVSLADFIERVVREEVSAFHARQEQRRFVRVLSKAEIEAAARTGKVDLGGSDEDTGRVNPDEAVQTAKQAFEDGLYLVLVDDQQYTSLDDEIRLRPNGKVTFVRLVALAGG